MSAPRDGFIADQIELPPRVLAAQATSPAMLMALWQFWGNATVLGHTTEFAVLTVTIPKETLLDLHKLVGNLPADYRRIEYDEDAAHLATIGVIGDRLTGMAMDFIRASLVES